MEIITAFKVQDNIFELQKEALSYEKRIEFYAVYE
jgi:hypothetical protein